MKRGILNLTLGGWLLTGCGGADFTGTAGHAASQTGSADATPTAAAAVPSSPSPSLSSSAPALPQPPGSTGPGDQGETAVPDPNTDGGLYAPIDPACASNAEGGGIFSGYGEPVSPPQAPLPETVPADCRTGVEFNDFHGSFALDADTAAGSRGLTLEVDIATYEAPDRLRLLADGPGGERTILDTCRLKTSTYVDPTGGVERPPTDSIRYFRPVLPAGTTAVRFDFTGSHTPQYIRVVGLCDFQTAPVDVQGGLPVLRPVP